MNLRLLRGFAVLALLSSLASSQARAITLEVNPGPPGLITKSVIPENGNLAISAAFGGLEGMRLDGSALSIDLIFEHDKFIRYYTAGARAPSGLIIAFEFQTDAVGVLLSPNSLNGLLIDEHGGYFRQGAITGTGLYYDGRFFTFVHPFAASVTGTTFNVTPFDFYGVHFDFTLPNHASARIVSSKLNVYAPYLISEPRVIGIGPGFIPPDIVPDCGTTSLMLAASLALIAVYRRRK